MGELNIMTYFRKKEQQQQQQLKNLKIQENFNVLNLYYKFQKLLKINLKSSIKIQNLIYIIKQNIFTWINI